VNIWQDSLFALRWMRKNPLFVATAILTLGLGIGGSTAMFTVIRSVLLKPLSYQQPERLVEFSGGATPTRFKELNAGTKSFTSVAAFTPQENMTLGGGAEPEVVSGVQVSAGFLDVLGTRPLLGRGFRPAEDAAGAPAVVMISFGFWDRHFDQDPHVMGRTLLLSDRSYTLVGVLPTHFEFPISGLDVWMPKPAEWDAMAPQSRPLSPILTMFGRLKPGMSLSAANAEMRTAHRRYAAAHPAMLDAKSRSPVELKLLKDEVVGSVRTKLWLLCGAVVFVLLITCANVASLLLARATSRGRELAIRAAVGASQGRLMEQLLCESILLSSAGGVFGLFLATLSLRAIPVITAIDLPRAGEIQPDWTVLLFATLLSIVSGALFGLLPSIHASRPDLINVLRGSGTAAIARNVVSARALLVVGQIALSVVLLIGAALLMQSLARLRGADVGFNPSHLLTAHISLPPSRYDSDVKKAEFFEEMAHRLANSPGVRSAAAAMFLPMSGFIGTPVQDAGKPPLKLNERTLATLQIVTPGYFGTLQVPRRRGRDFTDRDKEGAERVAIISEATARQFWPNYPAGLDPVGQRLLVGGIHAQPARIIGIVTDVHQNLENSAWPVTVYEPFAQEPQPFAMVAIRTGGDPSRFASTIRAAARSIDRGTPVSKINAMDDLVDEELGQRRLVVILLNSFAGTAMTLALIGIYGTVSYSVTQRTQEFGIRAALGAQQRELVLLVIRQAFGLSLVGVIAGIAGALALTRFLTGMLFEVKANDPATYLTVALLVTFVGLAASYFPARKASQTDPIAALRV
jgi:putative ABC transport system permease protein